MILIDYEMFRNISQERMEKWNMVTPNAEHTELPLIVDGSCHHRVQRRPGAGPRAGPGWLRTESEASSASAGGQVWKFDGYG